MKEKKERRKKEEKRTEIIQKKDRISEFGKSDLYV